MSESIPETHSSSGGNAFTRKLGPLPVWGYAAIIVAVGFVFWYYKNHVASPTSSAVNSSVPTATDAGSIAGASGTLPSAYNGTVSTLPLTPASPTTNAQWSKFVADSLIALGYSPDTVDNALSAYVNGTPLDPTSQSLVNVALQKFGNPPQGVLPITAAQTTPAPGYIGTKYTVQSGDTIQSIMQRFYGKEANNITARILTDTNPGAFDWNQQAGTWQTPKAGTVITLGPNGIAGVQSNTLTAYDTGHVLTDVAPPAGSKVVTPS